MHLQNEADRHKDLNLRNAMNGNTFERDRSVKFSEYIGSLKYLNHNLKIVIIKPLIVRLEENLDNFSVENCIVSELEKFSDNILP